MAAWTHIYKHGLSALADSPTGYGIIAIKNELTHLGLQGKIVRTTPSYGDAVREQVKIFQKKEGLSVDGEVGPETARALFRTRANQLEKYYSIPVNLLNQQKTLESNNDPAAIGQVDPDDKGLMQIHLPFFPNVTEKQAFTPAFSMDWAAKKLVSDHKSAQDWDGALAAYNIGLYYAIQWVKAGKPKSGGPIVGSNGVDLYTTASNYVTYVHNVPV